METSGVNRFTSPAPQAEPDSDADNFSQTRLTEHLESLLDPSFLNRADAEIVLAAGCGVTGAAAVVGAYSCLLARSPFFRHHISSQPAGERLRFELAELVPGGHRIGRDALVSVLGYLYTARPPQVPPQECVDDACMHRACRPAIDFVVQATYATSGFKIPELVSLCQRRLFEIFGLAYDEDKIPITIVAYECQLRDLLDYCIQGLASSNLDNTYLEKKLPDDVYSSIKEFRCSFLSESHTSIRDPDHESTNIHEALDSGNVDLVGKLLEESMVTLDCAFAIHYAAAHCNPEVLAELLKLDSVNVNMWNNGGYTPLHMACMRLEPHIIISLLMQGASVLDRTRDGRDALTICKRLTRKEKDASREFKKEKRNPYLCIKILEQAKRALPFDQIYSEETIVRVTPLLVRNFLVTLQYLERRVEFAKLFFPSEAQLAMRIAEADSTEQFSAIRLKEIGLNVAPEMHRKLRERFDALTKTGKRYFPNCSDVLDNLHNEESALTILGSGMPEDQRRMCSHKFRKDLDKAFSKDKIAGEVVVPEASSSPTPRGS